MSSGKEWVVVENECSEVWEGRMKNVVGKKGSQSMDKWMNVVEKRDRKVWGRDRKVWMAGSVEKKTPNKCCGEYTT